LNGKPVERIDVISRPSLKSEMDPRNIAVGCIDIYFIDDKVIRLILKNVFEMKSQTDSAIKPTTRFKI
jgi:hypothetical protein